MVKKGEKLGYKRKSIIPNRNQLRALAEGRKEAYSPEAIRKRVQTRKAKDNYKHSEETKLKISKNRKGIRASLATEFKPGVRKTSYGTSSTICHKIARRKMEEKTGRKFNFNEVVHHINGDWKDNRIENLCVMSRADHCRLHQRGIGQ